MIRYFDRTMVEHNAGFTRIYQVLFFAGIFIVAQSLVICLLHWILNRESILKAGFITVLENVLYLAIFIILSAVAMTKDFVKSQCPDVGYIIFSFILAVISFCYLSAAWKKTACVRGKKTKEEV